MPSIRMFDLSALITIIIVIIDLSHNCVRISLETYTNVLHYSAYLCYLRNHVFTIYIMYFYKYIVNNIYWRTKSIGLASLNKPDKNAVC